MDFVLGVLAMVPPLALVWWDAVQWRRFALKVVGLAVAAIEEVKAAAPWCPVGEE